MLRQRSASAVIIVLAAIIPSVLGHPVLAIAVATLAVLAVSELSRALQLGASQPATTPAMILAAALVLGSGFSLPAIAVAGIATLGILLVLSLRLITASIEGATRDIGATIFIVAYIAIPLAHLPAVRSIDDHDPAAWLRTINDWSPFENPSSGLAWLVLIVAITWLTDTGAYLVGRSWGRRKMSPRLSPNKTVEGAVAGIAAGTASAAIFAVLLGLPLPLYVAALMGLLLSIAGQLGDLVESLIKRDLGVKDMGNVIPGHGGILDRIDALLFTLPVGFYLIKLALEINWP